MNQETIIKDEIKLNDFTAKLKKAGPDTLHVLADFDRTFTKFYINGQKVHSLISILRDENYLTPNYATEAKELLNKYHPIEIDPGITEAEKTVAMKEWWSKHFELLIRSRLNIKDLESILNSDKIQVRNGVPEFLELLRLQGVPLIIMSASGLGCDSISLYLKKNGWLSDNIHIISNVLNWDKDGFLVSVKQPIIHNMNKDETVAKSFSFFDLIKDRKNVLLLGDSLGDVKMITGFDYDNLLKVGFLNDEIDKNLKTYRQNFDVIITNDGPFDFINKFLDDIISN